MSEEQFQHHVDFMLAQQAKFDANMARLEENHARHERENREMFVRLGNIISGLAHHSQEHNERIAANEKQIAELIEHGKETDRRFKETDERFRETDERINALIGMAERFFNKNGN